MSWRVISKCRRHRIVEIKGSKAHFLALTSNVSYSKSADPTEMRRGKGLMYRAVSYTGARRQLPRASFAKARAGGDACGSGDC